MGHPKKWWNIVLYINFDQTIYILSSQTFWAIWSLHFQEAIPFTMQRPSSSTRSLRCCCNIRRLWVQMGSLSRCADDHVLWIACCWSFLKCVFAQYTQCTLSLDLPHLVKSKMHSEFLHLTFQIDRCWILQLCRLIVDDTSEKIHLGTKIHSYPYSWLYHPLIWIKRWMVINFHASWRPAD